MSTLLLMLISVAQAGTLAGADSWTPPIGIPIPSFGICDTYRMYDEESARNESLTYYASASGGYFTHYVDSTDPNATDSGNAYGSIAKPRLTVPYPLAAGSVVEIHNAAEFTSGYNVVMNGTSSQPVFIRGVNKPQFENGGIIKGSYGILEGIYLYTGYLGVRIHNGSNAHHICIRNCELKGAGIAGSDGAGVQIYSESGNVFHDIVIYNNHIHHGGDSEAEIENDVHGVAIGSYCEDIWILENNIHHMGGDSVQVSHGADFTTQRVYIGKNTFHDDRENAVDIKEANHVIVSENEMYGYEPCSSAMGEACVVHYDPKYICWLFNRIHDSTFGIVSTGCSEQYIIGNLIFNISGTGSYSTEYSPHRQGIGIRWYNTGNTYVTNNILYNCITGLGADILSYPITIANNIFCNMNSDGAGYHLSIQGKGVWSSRVFNSLFFQSEGSVRIYWGDKLDVMKFQSDPNIGDGCIEADPLFVDPENGDFNLQDASPFLEVETSEETESVFDCFMTLYGIDLREDIEELPRTIYPHTSGTSSSSSNEISPATPEIATGASNIENYSYSAGISPTQITQVGGFSKFYVGDSERKKITALRGTKLKVQKIFNRFEELYGENRRGATNREYFE